MSNHLLELVQFMHHRYHTYDPFILADKLNIERYWDNIGPDPLGETVYDHGQPIVLLANSIKDKPQRYFVMAHELAHVVEHADLAAYYISSELNKGKLEVQANKFATTLLTNLYVDETGELPGKYNDLVYMYGFPVSGED